MKDAFDEFTNRLDAAEELKNLKVNKYKFSNLKWTEKKLGKIGYPRGIVEYQEPEIHVIRISDGKEAEGIFEEIMDENFQNEWKTPNHRSKKLRECETR